MPYTAWGIAPDGSGNGTTPQTLRRSILAQYANVGVLSGLAVSTTSGLSYSVAAGAAVCSRSSAYGAVIAYEDAATVTTIAGDATNPRYDVVYLHPRDVSQGDSVNTSVIAVVNGTPAASPSIPAIPTGAVRLGLFLVPKGMTATSQATNAGQIDYAVPYSAGQGVIAKNQNTTQDAYAANFAKTYIQQVSFYLPTDRQILLDWRANVSANSSVVTDRGSFYMNFQVDGVDVPNSSSEFEFTNVWQTRQHQFRLNISQGQHTARVAIQGGGWGTVGPKFRSADSGGRSFIGRLFQVVDEGIAK